MKFFRANKIKFKRNLYVKQRDITPLMSQLAWVPVTEWMDVCSFH